MLPSIKITNPSKNSNELNSQNRELNSQNRDITIASIYTNIIRNSRSADTSGSIGGDGGERELADGNGSTITGGEARGTDAAAAGSDGEKIEVVVARWVGAVLGLGADGEGAAAAAAGERK